MPLNNAQLKDLEDGAIVVAVTDSQNYSSTIVDTMAFLTNKKNMYGVYVTINRPYDAIQNMFKSANIDTDKIFFIDLISGVYKTKREKGKNYMLLPSVNSLTEISIAISEVLSAIPAKDKFLFFDSINTMLIYHSRDTAAKFIHFLTGKLREWNVEGVLLVLETDADKALIAQVSQFCDRILKTNT